jgi:hypothetical protein
VWKVLLVSLSDPSFAVEKQGPFARSHLAHVLINLAASGFSSTEMLISTNDNSCSTKERSGLAPPPQLLKISDNIQGDCQSNKAGRRRILQGMSIEGQPWPLEICSISSLQLSFYVPVCLLARLC